MVRNDDDDDEDEDEKSRLDAQCTTEHCGCVECHFFFFFLLSLLPHGQEESLLQGILVVGLLERVCGGCLTLVVVVVLVVFVAEEAMRWNCWT